MSTIKPDAFAKEMQKILQAYGTEFEDGVKDDVRAVTKESLKILRQNAPKRSGKYRKSFRSAVTKETASSIEITVHSTIPGLPHLLENPHKTRNGKRTKAQPHWEPAQEAANKMLEKRVEARLKK